MDTDYERATEVVRIIAGGHRLEMSDEAHGFNEHGAPIGWTLFCPVGYEGDMATADELRAIADAMDEHALRSGKAHRDDVNV